MKIGILALQGAVEPHALKLVALGATPAEVRVPEDLTGLSGIILPGGESTAMIHLLKLNRLWEPLGEFVSRNPSWGVCAGAILLAKKVTSPAQQSLGALSINVERNAFGRQIQSFIDSVEPAESWPDGSPVEAVFIRAPRIRELGEKVKVLFQWKGEPVMVEEGHCLASTFHPELTSQLTVHEYFLKKCATKNP